MPAEGDGEDEVVAVLTNNDQTVRVYSLMSNIETFCLDFPFAMNHATISPDGQLLVAVGDKHIGYFFERVKTTRPNTMKTPEGRLQTIMPEWEMLHQIRLYIPQGSTLEGYFTTAWSQSGSLCALGSEGGFITLFDVERLKSTEYGEEAVVEVVGSSRPDSTIGPGAVRTMLFSPAPWDLLIWSEDQAHVCVADIRRGLQVRQVLVLDPKDDHLERTEIADFDLELSPVAEVQDLRREEDFIRRYRRALDSEGTAAAVNFATDYIEASSERRRQHLHGVVESDNDPQGVTAQERQILEALRTVRRSNETRDHPPIPRSINYSIAGTSESARRYGIAYRDFIPSLRADARRREREATARRNAPESLVDSMLNQTQDRTAPRRQTSVVINTSGSFTGDQYDGAAMANITDSAPTRSPNPIPAHARRADAQVVSSTDGAWRTIEEALSPEARAAAPMDTRRLRQLAQMRERLRGARGEETPAYTVARVYRQQRGSTYDPSHGVRTAGLAMSQDGRILYCGTEEGIFEFRINLHQRKGFPAITPR